MKLKKINSLLVFILFLSLNSKANETHPDSTKNHFLDEIVVISNPKAANNAFVTPSSISLFNANIIEKENLSSIKDFSALAPNFFIPDYGSKLTTAIYIRGIGTRTNNSVVGLYVDNIPYLDKSIFDFDLLEIERMEILRGPQSTLYGRNTMAGLINIYTKSPFNHHFTRASVNYGSYNYFKANISRYGKISDKLAYSLSAQYKSHDGYFKNTYNSTPADSSQSTNGRIQFYWKPNKTIDINLSSNIEYSRQSGYAYGIVDNNKINDVNYNDPGSYSRLLSASSLFIEKRYENMILTSATGYQFFDDQMKLDQDFTPKAFYTLNQNQRQNSISQEIILKSKNKNNFKWLGGLFGFYQKMETDAPVDFKKDGIHSMINSNIKIPEVSAGPVNTIVMYDSLTNNNMIIEGKFKTPTYGAAAFTKLTYDNFIINGLSISAGIRADYEHSSLNYDTYADAKVNGGVKMKITTPMGTTEKEFLNFNDQINVGFNGKKSMDNFELLPRFELVYSPCSHFVFYGNISKGYRAGGYNFQMFSDAIQASLKGDMMANFIKNAEDRNMGNMIPENIKEMAKSYQVDIEKQIQYKPEYSWNYEIGARADMFGKKLFMEASVFYIDVENQQVSSFSQDGLGRVTKNSGKSRSAGVEAGIKIFPIENLSFAVNYGYTNAKFTDNENQIKVKDENGKTNIITVNYKNNYVPFAPKHTMSATANYTLNFNNKLIDNINFNLNCAGAGRIYWIEDNSAYQDFYGTLNGKISARTGIIEFGIWGRNLTNTKYQAFYFQSMGNRLAEKGTPLTFGGELVVRF